MRTQCNIASSLLFRCVDAKDPHNTGTVEQTPLPETAQVIADVIGREATLKLAGMVQNRNVYVPKRVDEQHWIARSIGYAKAQALAQEFGGLLLPLATCGHYYTRERNAQMRAQFLAGASTNALAQQYGLTLRRAQQIVADLKR